MRRSRLRIGLALGGFAALVYTLTAAPGISWKHLGEDGPEFAAIGMVLGISHPTGYPLFALLLRVATVLGGVLGFEPAACTGMVNHLAAGACVTAAAVLFMLLLRQAGARYYEAWGGAIGAALFAASPGWWGQAAIIEVYPLHLLLAVLVLLAAATWGGSGRRLALAGFLVGLGFAHHLQMLLILPAAIWLVWTAGRPGVRALAGALLCGSIPLTLYLVLFLRSRLDPPLDWGNPESLRQLAWVVSGAQYRFRMFHADPAELLRRVGEILGGHLPDQFGWSVLPLALLGLVVFWRRSRREMSALLLLFVVQLIWAVNYSIPDPDAYYLPAMLAVAGCAGGGAGWLLQQGLAGEVRRVRILGLMALILALSQPIVRLPETWRRIDLSRDHEAAHFARTAVAALPESALVLTDGDGRTFALWYEQIRQQRLDTAIVYRPLLQWRWCLDNLRRRYPDLRLPEEILPPADMQRQLLADALGRRPVFTSYSDRALARNFVHVPVGALFRVDTLRVPVKLPAWPGLRGLPLPLESVANADRRFDPFTPGSRAPDGPFPELDAGSVAWGDVQFATPTGGAEWSPNCLTTSGAPGLRAALPLAPEPSRAIALLLSARGLEGDRPHLRAVVEVRYRDGRVDRWPIRAFREVWNHDTELQNLRRPEELETGTGSNGLLLPLDVARVPESVTIAAVTPEAREAPDRIPAGIVVLAITQLPAPNAAR